MDRLLYIIPSLACPVGMGAMMWLMMRSGNGKSTNAHRTPTQPPEGWIDPQQAELASLRAEVDQLRAEARAPIADAVPNAVQGPAR
jgi:hypothetical protein